MTITLIRPAPARAPGVGPVTLVRVRPAPVLDPPYDDDPDVPEGRWLVRVGHARPGGTGTGAETRAR